MAADYMVAFCAHCSEPLYRSVRPMEPGQKGDPSDFAPISEEIPPPEGDVPTCYTCGGTLKVVPESMLRGQSNAGRAAQAQRKPATVTTMPRPTPASLQSGVETLFECVDGEQIVNIGKDAAGLTIVLTNRRIVRLNV